MSVELHLTGSPGEIRAGVVDVEKDTLLACALWRPAQPDGWGDRHLARVTACAPAFGGAFVQLENKEEAFLSTREKFREGQLVAAEVVRSAQNGKGLRLRLLPDQTPAHHADAPKLLASGPSPLEELAAHFPHAPLLTDCAATAARLPAFLRTRITDLQGADTELLESSWDHLAQPTVPVGPLLAHITSTPALVAIDLDTPNTPDFNANLAAFPALLREIRLRNLSGTLLIDPAGVPTRKRPALVDFLKKALDTEQDPLAPRVTGATPSGLLELTRPRRRPTLQELLDCPHGRGLAILRTILRDGLPGTELHASPALVAALQSDPQALDMFHMERAGRQKGEKLRLVASSPTCHSAWHLT